MDIQAIVGVSIAIAIVGFVVWRIATKDSDGSGGGGGGPVNPNPPEYYPQSNKKKKK